MPRRPLICFFLRTRSYGGVLTPRPLPCYVAGLPPPPRRRGARPRFFPGFLLIPGPRHSSLLVPSILRPVFVIIRGVRVVVAILF
ncbi:hypothetical protein B0H16DRAFT_1585710 [Mycena metata]|uniref:Uncharacterized protein n=1 Tax=Mycena metata TaxID=1033252 RepID=A0AAD7MS27_9AGAR|nr:hypothetical protein B0H16DRAFT_1585710 [Mycena metata]